MAGSASFTISEADYLAASRLHARWLMRQPRMWTVYGVTTASAAAIWGGMAWLGGEDGRTILAVVLLSSLVLPLMPLLVRTINRIAIPRRVRRFYAQQTMLRVPLTSSWDDEGMRWEGTAMASAMAWPAFYGWMSDADSTILLQTDMLFNIVPLRALGAGQRADLEATLVAHGPPRR